MECNEYDGISTMLGNAAFTWEEAGDACSREEVYRFRYEQYFASREYLPGADHAGRRVWLPHDDVSQHFLARRPDGLVVAVGTATPASEPSLLAEWRIILDLERLRDILPKTTIVSRTIVAEEERHSGLFGHICLQLASFFLEAGYHYAVHYCAPGITAMYERLGYRQYGRGRNLEAGVFRVPMFLVADDMPYFRRIHSPFRTLGRDMEANRSWLETAYAICPELAQDPLCTLTDAAVAAKMRTLCAFLNNADAALVRTLRRGSLLRLREGDVLAPEGIDEGMYLLLSGCLSCGGAPLKPGCVVRTGSEKVQAEEDTLVVCANLEGVLA